MLEVSTIEDTEGKSKEQPVTEEVGSGRFTLGEARFLGRRTPASSAIMNRAALLKGLPVTLSSTAATA